MLPNLLSLIALLAPPMASATDLDCMSLQSCTNGECRSETNPFSVQLFDAKNTAIVTAGETIASLPQTFHSGNEPSGNELQSIYYGDPNSAPYIHFRMELGEESNGFLYTFGNGNQRVVWLSTCHERATS